MYIIIIDFFFIVYYYQSVTQFVKLLRELLISPLSFSP